MAGNTSRRYPPELRARCGWSPRSVVIMSRTRRQWARSPSCRGEDTGEGAAVGASGRDRRQHRNEHRRRGRRLNSLNTRSCTRPEPGQDDALITYISSPSSRPNWTGHAGGRGVHPRARRVAAAVSPGTAARGTIQRSTMGNPILDLPVLRIRPRSWTRDAFPTNTRSCR